jgi:hypothetical protein
LVCPRSSVAKVLGDDCSTISHDIPHRDKQSTSVQGQLNWHSLIFDFHATTRFDFFSAMYFLIARRFFCLLRLCLFFRASCFFMLILLVRRDKPAGCLRMGVPHG